MFSFICIKSNSCIQYYRNGNVPIKIKWLANVVIDIKEPYLSGLYNSKLCGSRIPDKVYLYSLEPVGGSKADPIRVSPP